MAKLANLTIVMVGKPLKLFFFCLLALSVWADERVDRLPESDRKWLEEEVVYIITDAEREVFLDLSTREERDRFIEAFWARRDPDPATLENEFQVEHYRRFGYANRVLGREATRPGWRTDRGKYYIILGEPMEIQRYDGYNEVVSAEIWFYNGDPQLGLPARFNLLFFRESDIGEYRLYHPLSDGPERLLRSGHDQTWQAQQHRAVDVLELVSMDLARASLTVDLTELSSNFLAGRNTIDPLELTVRPVMNVQRVLADIESSPARRVDTRYLEGYRRFGHRVTADYSFRFFNSRSLATVLYGPERTPFLHFAFEIDPEHLTLQHDDRRTRYYTTLEVDLEVRDKEGRVVAYETNQPLLQLSAHEFEQARSFPFAYRDNYPLVPGDYLVSVILKNRATREYTAAEFELRVPAADPDTPALSELVLGYDHEASLAASPGHRAFQVGSAQIYPSMENVFTIGSTVHAFVQAFGPVEGREVRFRIESGEKTLHEERARVPGEEEAVVKPLPLFGLESGFYTVRADLLDREGGVVATQSAALTVSPRNAVPRPAFVYRHSFNVEVPGLLDLAIGNQLMATGRIVEAEARLEKAVAAENPALPMARWRLASVVLFSRKADRALELLLPLEENHPDEYEVVEGIGFAYYIKEDYVRARDYLERSAGIRTPDTTLLNALGDCYERLGETEKAKELYQRSLELNPEQNGVKARLAGLTAGQ